MTHELSIIIPHKDIPDLLRRCLASIPDNVGIQVIVVDDNSSPDVVDFDNFPGSERDDVTIIFDKQGGGAGHARNIGLSIADGKWVMFADADDWYMEDFYSIISPHLGSDADVILFKAAGAYSDTGLPAERMKNYQIFIDRCLEGRLNKRETMLKVTSPCPKMHSLRFLEENDIRFEEIMYGNDLLFSAKVACLAKSIEVYGDTVYVATIRSGSLSYSRTSDSGNFLARWAALIRCNQFLRSQGVRQFCLTPRLKMAMHIGWETFFKAFCMLLRHRMLHVGMVRHIRKKIRQAIDFRR